MSSHSRSQPQLTLEQYEQLIEDGRYRSELSHGLLIREPRPGALHSHIALELTVLLREYVAAHGLGMVVMEGGFRLSAEPPIVRGPDVAFISKARLPAQLPLSWWPFAPDLAIEIVSPGKTVALLQAKILEYFGAGTRAVWVIEPRTGSVTVYRSLADISILRAPATLTGGELLPGLELALDAFLP